MPGLKKYRDAKMKTRQSYRTYVCYKALYLIQQVTVPQRFSCSWQNKLVKSVVGDQFRPHRCFGVIGIKGRLRESSNEAHQMTLSCPDWMLRWRSFERSWQKHDDLVGKAVLHLACLLAFGHQQLDIQRRTSLKDVEASWINTQVIREVTCCSLGCHRLVPNHQKW